MGRRTWQMTQRRGMSGGGRKARRSLRLRSQKRLMLPGGHVACGHICWTSMKSGGGIGTKAPLTCFPPATELLSPTLGLLNNVENSFFSAFQLCEFTLWSVSFCKPLSLNYFLVIIFFPLCVTGDLNRRRVSNPQLWRFAFQKAIQRPARSPMGLQSVCLFTSSGTRAARQLAKQRGWGVHLELAPIHCAFQSRLGDTLNKALLLVRCPSQCLRWNQRWAPWIVNADPKGGFQ